jgi:hypothetical protein
VRRFRPRVSAARAVFVSFRKMWFVLVVLSAAIPAREFFLDTSFVLRFKKKLNKKVLITKKVSAREEEEEEEERRNKRWLRKHE